MNTARCGARSLCPALAVMLHVHGMSQDAIAAIAGCSQNAVSHALMKRVGKGAPGRKRDEETIERAMKMARSGLSYYDIERKLGVSRQTVSK